VLITPAPVVFADPCRLRFAGFPDCPQRYGWLSGFGRCVPAGAGGLPGTGLLNLVAPGGFSRPFGGRGRAPCSLRRAPGRAYRRPVPPWAPLRSPCFRPDPSVVFRFALTLPGLLFPCCPQRGVLGAQALLSLFAVIACAGLCNLDYTFLLGVFGCFGVFFVCPAIFFVSLLFSIC